MELLLWRHAEAEDGYPDADRRLTPRGEQQAQRMAAWIKGHAPKNLRILVSPATRCQQTAAALGLPFETDSRLSTAGSVADLLATAGWPDASAHDAVLIVGHQPTLGRSAALLLSGREDEWGIKKGALLWFGTCTQNGVPQTALRTSLTQALAKSHPRRCSEQASQRKRQDIQTKTPPKRGSDSPR